MVVMNLMIMGLIKVQFYTHIVVQWETVNRT